MKISDRYHLADCLIKDNQLYRELIEVFQRLFAPPPVADPRKLSYHQNGGFHYRLSEIEEQFYRDHYMLLSERLRYETSRLSKYFSEGDFSQLCLGETERKVLGFLL